MLLLMVILIIVAKTTGDGDVTKVAIEKAGRHTITEVVTATGKIYPETEVKIAPEVSGEITMLNLQEYGIASALFYAMLETAACETSQRVTGESGAAWRWRPHVGCSAGGRCEPHRQPSRALAPAPHT